MLLTSTVNTTFCFIITKTNSIVNTFTPFDSIISGLMINKIIEHPFGNEYVIPEDIAFDFKLQFGSLYANTTIKTTNGNIVADQNGSITVSVKPNKAFLVSDIDAGTKVTVTEIQKTGNGFTVKNGNTTMEGIVAQDGSLRFDYINIYSPMSVKPTNVSITGTKILGGRAWQKGDSFSFTLEQKNADETWSSLATKTITYSENNQNFNSFNFTDVIRSLNFEKIGSYDFRITEVIGNLQDIAYDKTANTFTVNVTDIDMDGKLEINNITATENTTVTKTNEEYIISTTFNNTYTPAVKPEGTQIDITINNIVKNTDATEIGPGGFEFILENIETGEKFTVESDKNGNALLNLPFTPEDADKEHKYKLYVVDEGIPGLIYDTTVYDISVSLKLDGDNRLVSTVIIDGQIVTDPVAEFIHTCKTDANSPSTSENDSHIELWFILMLISGISCIALAIFEKKHSN